MWSYLALFGAGYVAGAGAMLVTITACLRLRDDASQEGEHS